MAEMSMKELALRVLYKQAADAQDEGKVLLVYPGGNTEVVELSPELQKLEAFHRPLLRKELGMASFFKTETWLRWKLRRPVLPEVSFYTTVRLEVDSRKG